MPLSRRRFLTAAAPLGLGPLLPACDADVDGADVDDADIDGGGADPVFRHGVASGDPLPDRVVLWTRVTPGADQLAPVAVRYWVASDAEMSTIVQSGGSTTGPERDYTVKVDVGSLVPGATYYYRFDALGESSVVGRTRTLPVGAVGRLRLCVVSCSNYAFGFFNAYRSIAAREDLDLVLHLGDYIYEYRNAEYGDGVPLGRVPAPDREILTLADYRERHAQYKTDPDLQEVHRQHPLCVVWDDHEVANDASRDGAQNHQPEAEGDYAQRKASALQAYREWMPIRELSGDDVSRIYRSFAVGDLADVILLDTRHVGRDAQAADECETEQLADPARSLLGAAQEAWLLEQLDDSLARGARWRLLGQQVMMGQLVNLVAQPACVFSRDQWDGYAASRTRLLTHLEERAIDNVVVLTGDIHTSWALDLSLDPFDPAVYEPASGSGSLAVELVTPAVTSAGIEDPLLAAQLTALVGTTHGHVKFVELTRRGYLLLDVTSERVQAEWYFLQTILERGSGEELAAVFEVRAGTNHLTAPA